MATYSIATWNAALTGDLKNASMTSDDIIASEKAGQSQLIESTDLPKQGNWKLLKSWGIEITGDADDLFYQVNLPLGWSKKATDHSMHSDLLDDKGRKRAGIFYKAAFYDRSATINPIKSRFQVSKYYGDGYSRDIELYQAIDAATDKIVATGTPVSRAFLKSDPSCVGAISGDLFYYGPSGEPTYTDANIFQQQCSADLAQECTYDFFYKNYHHVNHCHEVINAIDNLAKSGLEEKIQDFLAGRDQWEID